MTNYDSNSSEIVGGVNTRKHWHPDDGWMGLVPGRSSIDDAKKKLGPSRESEMANGWSYDFHEGCIRISVIAGEQPLISKIWVSRDLADPRYMPRNFEEACSVFGPMSATARGELSEVFFEAPGVRLAILSGTDPESVLWMELYRP